MDVPEKNISFSEAKTKLESYCDYQERCKYDVIGKIKSWNFSIDEENKLINYLIEYSFLNEQRYADSYVSGKFRIKGWGKNKIKMHLKQKKISDEIIRKALLEIDVEDYFNTLFKLAEKKDKEYAKKQLPDWNKTGKLFVYLSSKGFEGDLIKDVLQLLKKSTAE